MRIDAFQRAKFTVQKLADHLAEPGIVLRKAGRINGVALRAQGVSQEFDLRALAAAIDSLDGDEFSASWHSGVTAYLEAVEASLTGERPRRNATRVTIRMGT